MDNITLLANTEDNLPLDDLSIGLAFKNVANVGAAQDFTDNLIMIMAHEEENAPLLLVAVNEDVVSAVDEAMKNKTDKVSNVALLWLNDAPAPKVENVTVIPYANMVAAQYISSWNELCTLPASAPAEPKKKNKFWNVVSKVFTGGKYTAI